MRASEIIRTVLDLIDDIENQEDESEVEINLGVANDTEEERRMDQVADLRSCDDVKQYSNSPRERIADISAVTTGAGDGWMGPKNPSDLRADSVSMFPNFQAVAKGFKK